MGKGLERLRESVTLAVAGATISHAPQALALPQNPNERGIDSGHILDIGIPQDPFEIAGIVINENPVSPERQKRILDFTIKNFIRTLASMNYSGFSLEIEITDLYGGKHPFYCRPEYEACLWYPPQNEEGDEMMYSGAGDIPLENLDVYIGTGSVIRLFPYPEKPEKHIRINKEEFEGVLKNVFGNIELNLQDEGSLEGGYLKEGAEFVVNNPYIFPLPYLSA